MIILISKNNVPVRLTIERWKHISTRHPELVEQKLQIFEAISNPDLILEGDFGTLMAAKFYLKTSLTSKYLIVIYKESEVKDGFIITAYYTNQISKFRRILWKSSRF
jgi:hypothetical protein